MADIVTVLDEGHGNSSYVVDIGDRRALVLNPERDPGWYLAPAEQQLVETGTGAPYPQEVRISNWT